ncbi:MAG TPA: C4-type zinc ribbon domain-containing protein, partial [Mucilaginibacter sp.]|nr:C4-type zinc ribbon domain-containing protein [Mucilaginibacter sp.]
RKKAKNGLAIVTVERDACSGCFNHTPAQQQAEIRLHQKIIVCEFCGRILVDEELVSEDSVA